MISRASADNKYLFVGFTKAEMDELLKDKERCATVQFGKTTIVIFGGDDERNLEEEFLKIITTRNDDEQSDADRTPGSGPGGPVHAKRRRGRKLPARD